MDSKTFSDLNVKQISSLHMLSLKFTSIFYAITSLK